MALNAYANDATLSAPSGTFTLNSGYFTAAWYDGLTIDVTGFNSGNQIDATSFAVNTSGPTLETFDWSGVDSVVFHSSGGTQNPNLFGGGTHFALDNLRVNEETTPTPEPGSVAAMGLGAFGVVGLAFRKRKSTAQ